MLVICLSCAPCGCNTCFQLCTGAELLRHDLRVPMSLTPAAMIHRLEAHGDAFTALAVAEVGPGAGVGGLPLVTGLQTKPMVPR